MEETTNLNQPEISEEISSLEVALPPQKPKKQKIILAALLLIFILISIPLTVYLAEQRQEIRKEAVGYGDRAHSDFELEIGPDYLDYVANGYGTKKNSSPQITLEIPSGSTVYKAYAIWGGERKSSVNEDKKITIKVNDNSEKEVFANLASWNHKNENYNTYQNSYLADITELLPSNQNFFIFKIGSFLEGYNNDGAGGAGHGISIIIVYKKSDNLYSKIKIKLWGEYIRGNTSSVMTFDFPDINTQFLTLKTAFFVGEAEGKFDEKGRERPNFLFYNGALLNPTDGTPYFGYSSDQGIWWDTRITGDDLPEISASEDKIARFQVDSPDETKDPQKRVGDSIVLHGAMLRYSFVETQCKGVKAYDKDWKEISNAELSELKPGDEVYFTVEGNAVSSGNIQKGRIKVNSGDWQETTNKKPGSEEFYITYTIPEGVTTFTVVGEVFDGLNWR